MADLDPAAHSFRRHFRRVLDPEDTCGHWEQLAALEAETKRLREALEWMQCRPHREGISLKRNTMECTDGCTVARAALKGRDD